MTRSLPVCLALLLAVAATTAAALSCGSTLTDVPMSGCTACIEFNITGMDKGHHYGPGGPGHKLASGGGSGRPDGPERFPDEPMLVPSCTECDTGNNFVLMTWNGSGPGRCGCADGFGTVVTSNVTVTVGQFTTVIPQFKCVACAAGEVPLGPISNVRPSYSNGTWTLVLVNSSTTPTQPTTTANTPAFKGHPTMKNNTRRHHHNRTRRGKPKTAAVSSAELPAAGAMTANHGEDWGGDQGGRPEGPGGVFPPDSPMPRPEDDGVFEHDGPGFGDKDGPGGEHGFDSAGRPPYFPGQCVACPEGSSTTDGISCVPL